MRLRNNLSVYRPAHIGIGLIQAIKPNKISISNIKISKHQYQTLKISLSIALTIKNVENF